MREYAWDMMQLVERDSREFEAPEYKSAQRWMNYIKD
jgi:hypothetical protein